MNASASVWLYLPLEPKMVIQVCRVLYDYHGYYMTIISTEIVACCMLSVRYSHALVTTINHILIHSLSSIERMNNTQHCPIPTKYPPAIDHSITIIPLPFGEGSWRWVFTLSAVTAAITCFVPAVAYGIVY